MPLTILGDRTQCHMLLGLSLLGGVGGAGIHLPELAGTHGGV